MMRTGSISAAGVTAAIRNHHACGFCCCCCCCCRRRRWLHATTSVHRPYAVPGQGGATEEIHIANAIRFLRDRKPSMVMEIMNACHVQAAAQLLPATNVLHNSAQIWIRVLTRADLLSNAALQYQMEQAGRNIRMPLRSIFHCNSQIPVIAMDLHAVVDEKKKKKKAKVKQKSLRPIMNAIAGAHQLVAATQLAPISSFGGTGSMVVCGLPNAGKSSLIYALTHHRTMAVRKKKAYHLPKISSRAGWTLSTKNHTFEMDQNKFTLTDTPGLRMRASHLDEEMTAHLLASGAMEPAKGALANQSLRQRIIDLLWQGLHRHSEIANESSPFASPDELWQADVSKNRKEDAAAQVLQMMRACRDGEYGGIVIEDDNDAGRAVINSNSNTQNPSPFRLSRGAPVVAMNEAAMVLCDIGEGKKNALEVVAQAKRQSRVPKQ